MAIDVEFNTTQIDSFVRKIEGNLKKATQALKAAANTVGYADIVDHFNKESGPNSPWVQRSSATQQMYAALNKSNSTYNPTNKLLQLTGNLRKSITPGSGDTKVIGQGVVKMYAGTIYSRTHDSGDPRRNIPQREFMWLSDKAKEGILEIVMNQVMEGT